jgi:hypothetical protein
MKKEQRCFLRYPGSINLWSSTYPKESIMDVASQGSIVHNFNVANYIATDPRRATSLSGRPHEPAQTFSSTDPITGGR